MQNLVNLLYREEEREMLPLCAAEGIGVIPWSPQARGKLSRDWNYTSIRTETDAAFGRLFAKTDEADRKVADRVAEVAKARGIPRAQVALAWLLSKPVITAPIVGATKLHHLDDAIASVAVKLTAEERSSRWRNPTFRTRWSVSSDSVLQYRTPREGTMPIRFSTRCPNSDYLGFEASPEASVTAAKKAEEVGFDAIFVNDHIIVDGSPPRSIVDQHFGIRSLRCRSLQRTRWLGSGLWASGRSRMSSFKTGGANPIQGLTLGRCGAHCHGKRAFKQPAPIRPMRKAASKSRSLK